MHGQVLQVAEKNTTQPPAPEPKVEPKAEPEQAPVDTIPAAAKQAKDDAFSLDEGDTLNFDQDKDQLVFSDDDRLDFKTDDEPLLSVEGLDDDDIVLPDADEKEIEQEPINPAKERDAGFGKQAKQDDIGEKSTDTQFEEALSTIQAPKQKKHRIWPWVSLILIALIAAGLWVKRDAWTHHPMVRSVLLKTGLSKTASGSDWWISPTSIQPRWSKDDQGKPVLIIDGKIENKLTLALPIPMFEVMFDGANTKPIVLPSILPDYITKVAASPIAVDEAWTDHNTVSGGESHPFTLVMHNLGTLGSQSITIRAVAGQ